MISFSQLNEQIYVDSILSESFLTEDSTSVRRATRTGKEQERIEVVRLQRTQALAQADVEIAKTNKQRDQYVAKIKKEQAQIERDSRKSEQEKEYTRLELQREMDLELKKFDFEIKSLEQEKLTKREEIRLDAERQKALNMQLQSDLAIDQERQLKKANQSFDDLFKDAAKGTIRGVAQATAYSIKSVFSWVRRNPKAAGGVTTAVVVDQILFNNEVVRAIGFMPRNGFIPAFFKFILAKISGAFSAISAVGILAVLEALFWPVTILAASGIGLYVAYRTVTIAIRLGEAKALQIAKRLESATEEEAEEILRRELKVNTRKLKKQRA